MKNEAKAIWENEKNCESDFWNHWILTKGDKWPDEFASRMDPNLPVNSLISNYLISIPNTPRLLDVGAGPLSFIGKILPDGRKIDLTPIDPLAKKYSIMFKQAGIKPLLETLCGEVEKLDKHFEPNTFDLVFMRNALDQAYDPITGVTQMLQVVKNGCVIILEHFINKAVQSNYSGLHQWNICVEDNDFILWNKTSRTNVSSELKDFAKITANNYSDSTMIILEKL